MVKAGKSRNPRRQHKEVAAVSEEKVSASLGRRRIELRFLLPLACFCWPIAYLFRYVFPINGQYTAVGNDFILLYYKYKVYLLACLADFHFPTSVSTFCRTGISADITGFSKRLKMNWQREEHCLAFGMGERFSFPNP